MRRHRIVVFVFCVVFGIAAYVDCCMGAESQTTPTVIDTSDAKKKENPTAEICKELFWEIIEIQNMLRAYQLGYQLGYEEMAHRHRAGQISDEKMKAYQAAYELAVVSFKTQLDEAYTTATTTGCFEKKE
jgi:hypothetical protein